MSQPDRDLDLDQFQFLRADAEKLADPGLRHFLGKKHADGTLVLIGQPVVEVPDDFDASFFFFMSFNSILSPIVSTDLLLYFSLPI